MRIEVFSDIACPWCYIGEKRLMKALEERRVQAQVEWKPFQLQPGIPREGVEWREFMAAKFGGRERMQMAFAQVARAGEPDGIEFNFERIPKAINTLQAHRLVLWAARFGKQWELADALFKAHFSDGLGLAEETDLLRVAASVGLEVEAARTFLAGNELGAEVLQSQQLAQQFGIQGVPFFVFERKYGLSGAQPLEVFLQVMDKVGEAAPV